MLDSDTRLWFIRQKLLGFRGLVATNEFNCVLKSFHAEVQNTVNCFTWDSLGSIARFPKVKKYAVSDKNSTAIDVGFQKTISGTPLSTKLSHLETCSGLQCHVWHAKLTPLHLTWMLRIPTSLMLMICQCLSCCDVDFLVEQSRNTVIWESDYHHIGCLALGISVDLVTWKFGQGRCGLLKP